MPKNIVVCCDGTGNQFAVNQTNVLRLHWALESEPNRQVTFYAPGVGTFSPSMALTRPGEALHKTLGLALGLGYRQTIENAYWFIAENFSEGDRIFLFGFSRGAYAVRIVAAMLHGVGILNAGNRHLVQFALFELEVRRGLHLDFEHLSRFRKQFSQKFEQKPFIFLGVWDTVSSVSWAYDYLRYAFTASNPSVDVVRHAVSIDEKRAFFAQNLFKHRNGQDIREVWFPGVHCDVGGGYSEADGALAKAPLQWMMVESRKVNGGGVLFNEPHVRKLLKPSSQPWYAGPIHESLTWKWFLAEFFPKENSLTRIPSPHLFRKRYLIVRPSDRSPAPKLRVHKTALLRMEDRSTKYSPKNLPADFDVEQEVGFFDR